MLIWEPIDNYHERAKVFGGWLVKAYSAIEHATYDPNQGYWAREQSQENQLCMAFVPDSKHEWEIKEIGV